jgi:hypothetical protein
MIKAESGGETTVIVNRRTAVFVIVNAITSKPKNQWTLADSLSERTVSMDSHSFGELA